MSDPRLGRVFAFAAALCAFVVYWLTLAHTITWLHNGADGGDLVTAAFVLGIPHPPGYPLYTLLAALFAHIPPLEPAHGVTIFSALMASAAVFVLARAGAALLNSHENPARFSESRASQISTALIAPIAALAFAFAPLLWSQATIAEVYALNLFFVAFILWTCMTNDPRRVNLAALTFGFGAAHHLAILLLAPGALVALRPARRDWRAVFLFLAPLVFYLYLPLAALPNPPVKWGDPVTLERFLWLVTAQLYRPYLFGVNGAEMLSRLAFTARALLDQFTLIGAALLVWGALQLAMTRARLFLATLLMAVPFVAYAIVYASRDSFLYLLPAFAIAALWMVYGVSSISDWVGGSRLLRGAAVALFAVLPVYNLVTNYAAMDVSRDRTALVYAQENFKELPVDGVLFADGDEALFAVWYYRHAVAFRDARSVVVSQGLLQYDWYYDSLRRIMSEVQFASPDAVAGAHARAREIMRVTFAEGRAVCFTDSSPLLPEFEYQERGVLKCVMGEKTQ